MTDVIPQQADREAILRDVVYPIIRAWDSGSVTVGIQHAQGHGSLGCDILESNLEALAEDVLDAVLAAIAHHAQQARLEERERFAAIVTKARDDTDDIEAFVVCEGILDAIRTGESS